MGQFKIDMDEVISSRPYRIGVLSDTHVPDRVGDLHPDILPSFKELNVDLIIHAGDISSPDVIRQLEDIAPVQAVLGNRDWWRFKDLAVAKWITIRDVKIMITHGQGPLLAYLWEKLPIIIFGYKFDRFYKKFLKASYDFDIVIFGHSHRAENRLLNGKLFFNPGSASDFGNLNEVSTIGLIEISSDKQVMGRIIKLRELKWREGKWVDS